MSDQLTKIRNTWQGMRDTLDTLEKEETTPQQAAILLGKLNVHAEQLGALTREMMRMRNKHRTADLPVPPTESSQRKRFPHRPSPYYPSPKPVDEPPPTTEP